MHVLSTISISMIAQIEIKLLLLLCKHLHRVLFGRQRRKAMERRQQLEEALRSVSLVEAGQGSTLSGTIVAPGINFDDLFETNTLRSTPAAFVKNRGIRSMSQFGHDFKF